VTIARQHFLLRSFTRAKHSFVRSLCAVMIVSNRDCVMFGCYGMAFSEAGPHTCIAPLKCQSFRQSKCKRAGALALYADYNHYLSRFHPICNSVGG
jgi:hypothetical protein